MKKVKKAIIPAAGLGTRFLPATKAMPKEMLPIVDKPTIQYIVEEAIESGIEDIIIVTGKDKRAIEDHFDSAHLLESRLAESEKFELLNAVQLSSKVDIHYIRQKSPLGLGHAVWTARKFIGDEPFAVLLGDDIIQSETPGLKQLMQQYEETQSSIIGVMEVPDEETYRYGILDPAEKDGQLYKAKKFVEKPRAGTAPSNLAIIGRYVFNPEIFQFLDEMKVGAGGEIQLTDAIEQLNAIQNVYGYAFDGKRYDVGETHGFVETTLEFALQRPELRSGLLKFMQQKLDEANK
ncbi:UTP--glucose-1-phosphate uridylyltransferase GalU [Planomicrobium sp. YIM 101495]|uniref:UTP--glucose-1-phosphate uridylyltransferase GalU n=1 Tax=Planomicrobium sp. YIM 101495 TaxID=2665160 RepID=UPI0012B88337|nr:UTP--glucose-1-phosphate uridylyltransferase GalU [Planomicrobium sp. YIM 101495]MTD30802.1 UTP--glucose-1-phosphate uridylyltransferase GalU [Planomicrobium sp. YIM 101495]